MVTLDGFRKDAGVLRVDLASSARRRDVRLAALEKRVTQLEKKIDAHEQSVNELQANVAILRATSEEYARVLRRCLIESALRVLVDEFPRKKDERWRHYLRRLVSVKGAEWLEGQGLPVDVAMSLLPKGEGTAYDDGCIAAHRLLWTNPKTFDDSYLKGLEKEQEEQELWKELYSFVKAKVKAI